jgi:serine/threonine protein phosphatase PrpC
VTAHTPSSNSEIIVHVFGKTDVGRTREHNEDAFVVADLTSGNATLQPEVRSHVAGPKGSLFMVADGMGGAAAGEIASQMATDVVLHELEHRWRQAAASDPESFAVAIKAATEQANARINRYAVEHPENRGMGTTATIAGLLYDTLYLAQVGDSRAYLVRDGVAQQITKDQSLMQKLIEAGEMTPEEAEVSERRNIILQALGPEPIVRVDLTTQKVRRNDVLVLCSDGLSGQMRTPDIAQIVTENPDLVAACKALIDLANENGGPDNITVIAVRFEGDGLMAATSTDDVGHKVYAGESTSRPTTPVSASSIPHDEITGEIAALPTSAATSDMPTTTPRGFAKSGGAAAVTSRSNPAKPEPRIPVAYLRVLFGLIAFAIAVYLYTKLRG